MQTLQPSSIKHTIDVHMPGTVPSNEMMTGLLNARKNPGRFRPFIGNNGMRCISVQDGWKVDKNTGMPEYDPKTGNRVPNYRTVQAPPLVANDTIFTRDQWIHFDNVILRVNQENLGFTDDLKADGLEVVIPNGFGKTVVKSQRVGHFGSSTISMSGISKGHNDRPEFDDIGVPLPIIHCDMFFDSRDQAISEGSGFELDATALEEGQRKNLELLEDVCIGNTAVPITVGGFSIYGVLNAPNTNGYVLTSVPGDVGWTPATLIGQLASMMKILYDDNHPGPYTVYFGKAWLEYMNADYSATNATLNLQQKILAMIGIKRVRILNRLSGWSIIMMDAKTNTIRLLNGMNWTTMQWTTDGGMMLWLKIMGIKVPEIRQDKAGQSGICIAETA